MATDEHRPVQVDGLTVAERFTRVFPATVRKTSRRIRRHVYGDDYPEEADPIQRVETFGRGGRARFQLGDFAATGFPDAAFDGAMSVDVLAFVPSKAAALHEVARILKAGSWFVFTAWDYQGGESSGITAPQVADHRPLLEAAGFTVAVYEATPRGERLERALYHAVLAAEDELINEIGEAAGRPVINEARNRLPVLDRRRRMLVVAHTE